MKTEITCSTEKHSSAKEIESPQTEHRTKISRKEWKGKYVKQIKTLTFKITLTMTSISLKRCRSIKYDKTNIKGQQNKELNCYKFLVFSSKCQKYKFRLESNKNSSLHNVSIG